MKSYKHLPLAVFTLSMMIPAHAAFSEDKVSLNPYPLQASVQTEAAPDHDPGAAAVQVQASAAVNLQGKDLYDEIARQTGEPARPSNSSAPVAKKPAPKTAPEKAPVAPVAAALAVAPPVINEPAAPAKSASKPVEVPKPLEVPKPAANEDGEIISLPGNQTMPVEPPQFEPPVQKKINGPKASGQAGDIDEMPVETDQPAGVHENMGLPAYRPQPRASVDLDGKMDAQPLAVAPAPPQAAPVVAPASAPAPAVKAAAKAKTVQSDENNIAIAAERRKLAGERAPALVPPEPQPTAKSAAAKPQAAEAQPGQADDDSLPAQNYAPSGHWEAAPDADMKDVLAQWANKAGVAFVWNTDNKFAVTGGIAINGSFEKAVEMMLGQYQKNSPRPVGTIYNDPKVPGGRVLVISSFK